jgi:hypothetical protein
LRHKISPKPWVREPRFGPHKTTSERAQKLLSEATDLTDEKRTGVVLEPVASLDGPTTGRQVAESVVAGVRSRILKAAKTGGSASLSSRTIT